MIFPNKGAIMAVNLFNHIGMENSLNKIMTQNRTTTLKTIELFAGVGGFRVGLQRVSDTKRIKNLLTRHVKTNFLSSFLCQTKIAGRTAKR